MDKQKQIEETHKEYVEWALGLLKTRFDLKPEFYDVHHHDNFTYECGAESLWVKIESAMKELLWLRERQIPENAVVLTEKELKEKIDCCDVSMIHHDDDGKRYIEYERYEDFTDRLGKRIQQLKGQLKQERKETAEKFAEMAKERKIEMGTDGHSYCMVFVDDIDEIAKEFTEGVK